MELTRHEFRAAKSKGCGLRLAIGINCIQGAYEIFEDKTAIPQSPAPSPLVRTCAEIAYHFDSRRLHHYKSLHLSDSSQTESIQKPDSSNEDGLLVSSDKGVTKDISQTLSEPKQSTKQADFTPLLRHQKEAVGGTLSITRATPEPSLPGGSGGPEATDIADKIDKTPSGLPADLAELAALWDRLPEALRASWVLTAKALAGDRQ